MMQIAKSVESFRFHVERAWILNRAKITAFGVIAAASLTATATGAFASCGPMSAGKSAGIELPALAFASPQAASLTGDGDDAAPIVSIVGLWHTKYVADGALFAESFKLWHGDGTELDNIDQDPALGSVCLGVWKPVGVRGVRLHHVGWMFTDAGKPAGSFTIEEADTEAENGQSYTGTFTFRTYDVNGKFTGTEVTGTIAATRITVN